MPDDFWPLTLRELILQQRGYLWRQEQDDWRMANIMSAIMNPLTTVQADPKKIRRYKTVTAADILGKGKKQPAKSADPQEHKRIFEALVEKTRHWNPREPGRKPVANPK